MKTIILIALIFIVYSCSSIDYHNSTSISNERSIGNKNEISLVTYNIKAIYDKKENEVDSLMNFIQKNNFDFVLFQELFDESTRDEIVERSDSNYQTIISRVDYNSFPEFLFQDAGLFVMSKYPRVDLSEIDFGDGIKNSNGVIHMILEKEWSKTNDFLANKSVLGALFSINDSTQLFLFTTHVQAIGTTEHKLFQLDQIKNFIDLAVDGVINSGIVNSSKNLFILLAGDFNSDAYNPERFNSLKNHLGNPRDLHLEFNGNKQECTFAFNSSRPSRRFDYIFAYDNLNDINFNKLKIKSICVDDVKVDSVSISDHRSLKATLLTN